MVAADVKAFARMGAYESLLSGVGFVMEHYYHGGKWIDRRELSAFEIVHKLIPRK